MDAVIVDHVTDPGQGGQKASRLDAEQHCSATKVAVDESLLTGTGFRHPPLTAATIMAMQRTVGNAAATRIIQSRTPIPSATATSRRATTALVQRHELAAISQEPASPRLPWLEPPEVLSLQRTADNAAVCGLMRAPAEVSTPDDVLLEPMQVSPPQIRVIGTYTDEQISTELYGRPHVPIRYLSADSVEVLYSTLLPKWKPAFRETASDWEKTEAERHEKVGHYDHDGKTVWEDGLHWRPIKDSRRGGMVVAYMHSSTGLTEVFNTAGELMYRDAVALEPVRIPIVDDIGDALAQVGYAAVGVVDAWLENNWTALGLPPKEQPLASLFGIPSDAIAYRVGRGGGHLVSLLQAAAEMVGGAALVLGGDAAFGVGVATTPAGGVGLVIMPVAVVTIAAGTTIVVHGGALAGAVFMSATGGGSGGGRGGGGRGGKEDLKQVDDVAKEFKMSTEQRNEFGEFLEAEKAAGNGGTKNKRGDFTYQELRRKAQEFLTGGGG